MGLALEGLKAREEPEKKDRKWNWFMGLYDKTEKGNLFVFRNIDSTQAMSICWLNKLF